jgi:hypothetical protein
MNMIESFGRLEQLVLDNIPDRKQVARIRNLMASMREQLEAYDPRMSELQDAHSQKMSSLEQSQAQEVVKLKQSYEEAIANLKKLHALSDAIHEERMRRLTKSHAEQHEKDKKAIENFRSMYFKAARLGERITKST